MSDGSDQAGEQPVTDSARMFGHHGPPPKRSLQNRIRNHFPRVEDFIVDRIVNYRLARIRASAAFRDMPKLRILAVGVQSPRRPGALSAIFEQMADTRHEMVFDQKDVEDKGKLENTNIILARHDLSSFDWVWTVDDDVALPPHFTDTLMAFAEAANLKIAGPAHRTKSYASYAVTRRRYDSLVRATSYVEVGPITCFRRETFPDIFPLPNLRYGWGIDLTWPALARKRGWTIGIVDAAAIEHLNPVAATYDTQAAVDEARAYMDQHSFLPREETWQNLRKWNCLPAD